MNRLMKVIYALGVMLMITVLVVINLQYKGAERLIQQESELNADLTLKLMHLDIVSFIEDQGHVLNSAKAFIEENIDGDKAVILSYLKNELRMNPPFTTLYYGSKDNMMINASGFVPPADFDHRLRPWYGLAVETGKLVLTEPFLNASEDAFIVTVATPVYDKAGELMGVVAGDIPVESMKLFLEDQGTLNKGVTYLASGEGIMIYASKEAGSKPYLLAKMQLLYNETRSQNFLENYGTQQIDFEGVEGYFHYLNVENSNWKLYSFTPASAFGTNYTRFRWIAYGIGLLLMVLFFALFRVQRTMIVKPLLELEQKIEAIDVERHPEYQIELNSTKVMAPLVDKINDLLSRINNMVTIIQEDRDELHSLNEELEASLGQLVATEQEVTRQKMNFEALFRNSQDAIAMFNQHHMILDVNKSFERLFGYKRDDIIGVNLDDVISNDEIIDVARGLTDNLFDGNLVRTEGVRYGRGNRALEVAIQGVPMVFDGFMVGGYGIYTDISDRKKRENYLTYVSTHDDLTDLYNRSYFESILEKMNVEANMPLGLVMMDVNGLKLINDAFGNSTGDALLRNTAMLIRGASRPEDVVARVGGDEFAIIMPKTSMETIENRAQHFKEICNEIKVGEVTVSVSLGWADKQNVDEPMALVLKTAEDYMNKHKLVEGPSVRGKAIYAMVKTLHEKNKREEQHSTRVGELSERLGLALGLSSRELNDLRTMGLLHDVGKIAIEDSILNKPSRLTKDEYCEIKKHPEIGYRILSSVNEMSEMAEYVFAHHEHWDGSGYPRGLKEFEIPYLARVISVVDAFDAMTSDRAYRNAMSYEKAYEELEKCANQQFDPAIVKVFVKEMKKSV